MKIPARFTFVEKRVVSRNYFHRNSKQIGVDPFGKI